MVKKIRKILEELGVEYKLHVDKIYRAENYYIKKDLEIKRIVDTKHYYLTIYNDFEEDGVKYKGSSQAEIHPTMKKKEIRKIIENAIIASGYIKNEYFDLVSPTYKKNKIKKSEISKLNLSSVADLLAEAFYERDNHEKGYLSYSEFFVYKVKTRIINSLGLDVSYVRYGANGETSAIWKEDKEIEVYDSFQLAEPDTEFLKSFVDDLFFYASEKSKAVKMPKIDEDTNILISGKDLEGVFRYFYSNSGAENVYNKVSDFKLNEPVVKDAIGDKINLSLDPFMKDSNLSAPYDQDGFILKEEEIIKDGILKKYWGSSRFSSYLSEKPTGVIKNFIITGGTYSEEELRKGKYLELVSFSDFSLDNVSGDFGSEIRLGFYFDGKNKIPVTGGSISGNINLIMKDIKMSKELRQFNNYLIPKVISIKGVNL